MWLSLECNSCGTCLSVIKWSLSGQRRSLLFTGYIDSKIGKTFEWPGILFRKNPWGGESHLNVFLKQTFHTGTTLKICRGHLLLYPHLGYNLFLKLKSIAWTHEKTSGKDIIRFYFCSPDYSGTHLSDAQWCRSSSFICPVRNVSWREVQGKSLLLRFEGIESSCPESVLIPQGPIRCHLFCEALPKPKPETESINLTFLFSSVVLSIPQSWPPVLGAFSVPLIQARNLVLFILLSPQSQHRAVVQFVELYWICSCKLTRKRIPKQSSSVLPRGKV